MIQFYVQNQAKLVFDYRTRNGGHTGGADQEGTPSEEQCYRSNRSNGRWGCPGIVRGVGKGYTDKRYVKIHQGVHLIL